MFKLNYNKKYANKDIVNTFFVCTELKNFVIRYLKSLIKTLQIFVILTVIGSVGHDCQLSKQKKNS